MDTSDLRNKLR